MAMQGLMQQAQAPTEGPTQQAPAEGPMQQPAPEGFEWFFTKMESLAAGDKHKETVSALLEQGEPHEGIGKALFFLAEAVEGALEKRGVEIDSSEKAAAMAEMSKGLALLAKNSGIDVKAPDVEAGYQAGMNLFMGQRAKKGELDLTGSGNAELDSVMAQAGMAGKGGQQAQAPAPQQQPQGPPGPQQLQGLM